MLQSRKTFASKLSSVWLAGVLSAGNASIFDLHASRDVLTLLTGGGRIHPLSWRDRIIITLATAVFVPASLYTLYLLARLSAFLRKIRFGILARIICSDSFSGKLPAEFPAASQWGLKLEEVGAVAGGHRGLHDVVFFDSFTWEVHPHSFTTVAIRSPTGSVPLVADLGKYGKQEAGEWTFYREGTLHVRRIRAILSAIPA